MRNTAVKQEIWAWPDGKDFMASSTSPWSSGATWQWEMLYWTLLRQ